MNEKDILKQSLKEIEEQLNSLGIPSEELKIYLMRYLENSKCR